MRYCIPFFRGYLVIDEDQYVSSIDYAYQCEYTIVDDDYSELARLLYKYANGYKVSFESVKVSYPYGSELFKKIWNIARRIPYGEVRSYKWIATKLGNPYYARVVGNAMAQNPVMIIVPCHRVIKSDGRLGGFSSGIELKKYLLRLEGIEVYGDRVLVSHFDD
jgi:O-6-methylguanine DNA methyltransferase